MGQKSSDALKIDFATRLQALMSERGLTAAETARRMRDYLPDGDKASRATVCHYRAARALPRPRYLDALSLALGVDRSALLSAADPQATGTRLSPMTHTPDNSNIMDLDVSSEEPAMPICGLEDLGEEVHLRISQRVSWAAALEILSILKADKS